MIRFLTGIIASYLVGSVPFGLLIAKGVKGIDLRQHGSGNIGATNVFRVVGKKWGILALLLDAAKGYAGVWVAARFFAGGEVYEELVFGLAAIMGHSFPVWLRFKGGKGVATSLGVFLAIVPVPTLIAFGLWAAVFAVVRIISVASLSAAVMFPVLIFVLCRNQPGFGGVLSVAVLLAAFIVYTHRANVRRLLRGEEKKLI